MTATYFKLHPAVADKHRESIYRIVAKHPGITRSQLCQKITYLNANDRRGFLAELIAAGRVSEQYKQGRNGKQLPTYWPAVPHENK
jgi:hypothetical protein